ncbi:MAG: MBOAT family O-acyltransferase [Bacteroidales bacterium]|nr:MBOAT family O-acyltransferase [Bacteroidales bacterium]
MFSFIFYGWWDWRFIFLIIGSGLIDFFAARAIYRYQRYKKLFLLISILGNIGSLMVFKYLGFLAENIEMLFAQFGQQTELTSTINPFFLILPVGISFYTFQSMSYTIDIYKGKLKPTRHILHFFAYLSMFPQLVAGPIIRARDFLPQLNKTQKITETERWNGLQIIVYGFFKKMVLADNIAPMVNSAFANTHMVDSSLYWWIVIIGFSFQIYFDFSGYSDIARGLAKWMGFHFRTNFNHPYLSLSLKEFWTRWHISLSTWFRDYVYIPLGGSKKGKYNAHLFMWITMLVSGLWHGAAWTFVVWGAIHAFYMSLERITKFPDRLQKLPLGKLWSLLVVNLLVLISWVFFRAQQIDEAWFILQQMFSFSGAHIPSGDAAFNGICYCVIALGIEIGVWYKLDFLMALAARRKRWLNTIFIGILIALCIILRGEGNQFIYFQF